LVPARRTAILRNQRRRNKPAVAPCFEPCGRQSPDWHFAERQSGDWRSRGASPVDYSVSWIGRAESDRVLWFYFAGLPNCC